MLPKYMSLFLASPFWKFHICDLNTKHRHHSKHMEIYKSLATFFLKIIENKHMYMFFQDKSPHILKFE